MEDVSTRDLISRLLELNELLRNHGRLEWQDKTIADAIRGELSRRMEKYAMAAVANLDNPAEVEEAAYLFAYQFARLTKSTDPLKVVQEISQ